MKQTLAKHWEKLALTASILILLAYAVFSLTARKPVVIQETDGAKNALQRLLSDKEVPLAPKPAIFDGVQKSFGTTMDAAPGEDNVYYKPTVIAVATVKSAAAVPVRLTNTQNEPSFKKPLLSAPVAEPGLVKLAWADDPATKNVTIAGYVVYRKSPGKDFVKLTAAPVTEKTYTDSAIEPKKEYQYAVAAVSAKAIEKLSIKANDEIRSEPAPVTTVGVLDIEMRGVAEVPIEPDQPPVPTAQLMVKKIIDGKWKSKLFLVRKGDKIGDKEFDTQYEVTDLARVMVQKVEEFTVPKFDDKGVKIGEEKRQKTREVQVWELKYLDDAGKPQKMYPAERAAAPVTPPPAVTPEKPATPATPAPKPPATPAPKPPATPAPVPPKAP
jgi:hypothetical protein